MSGPVTFEPGDEISTIRLDDGKANVMATAMSNGISSALDRAEDAGKPVVIAGREGTFSGGFDLATFDQGGEAIFDMLHAGAANAERLFTFPTPVVMACTGHSIAMGLFLMLTGDERIGAAGDFTLQANEVEIGLGLPRFASVICRQRLHPDELSRMLILAEPYSPAEAERAGILTEVVPEDDVLDRARERAQYLSRLDLDSYRTTKQRVHEPVLEELRAAIDADVEDWEASFT